MSSRRRPSPGTCYTPAETPVVVVGAMRNAGQPDYDGPANLRDAVRVAIEPQLRDAGVLVVMDGRILPADDVTKTDSQALDTFRALNTGALGSIIGRRGSCSTGIAAAGPCSPLRPLPHPSTRGAPHRGRLHGWQPRSRSGRAESGRHRHRGHRLGQHRP